MRDGGMAGVSSLARMRNRAACSAGGVEWYVEALLVDRLPKLKKLFIGEAAGLSGSLPKLLKGEAI